MLKLTTVLFAALAASSASAYVTVGGPKHVRHEDSPPGTKNFLVSGAGFIKEIAVNMATGETKIANGNNFTVEGPNPSWMTLSNGRLYAVDENSEFISSYLFNTSTHQLELKDRLNATMGLVHLATNLEATRMVGSGYGSGQVVVIDISDAEGKLKLMKTFNSTGHPGPVTASQSKPHPHNAALDPTGRYFCINDLGTDTILVLDSKDDAWTVANHVPVVPAGSGPRHGVFYPQNKEDVAVFGKVYYMVVCELSNTMILYTVGYGASNLSFFQVQTISTYGLDFLPKAPSTGAAGGIVLVPRGGNISGIADVYITNRLTGDSRGDNVVHFVCNFNDQGSCELKGHYLLPGGVRPRAISIDASQANVLVANTDNSTGIVGFRRDLENGVLKAEPFLKVDHSFFTSKNEAFTGPAIIIEHDASPRSEVVVTSTTTATLTVTALATRVTTSPADATAVFETRPY